MVPSVNRWRINVDTKFEEHKPGLVLRCTMNLSELCTFNLAAAEINLQLIYML